MGRPGVEATLRSASRAPTQHLAFLVHKGGLLRVTQDGDIQLFSAVSRRLLTSTWLQGDAINAVAPLPAGVGPGGGAVAGTAGSDAYVLLGCESGSVRVVAVLDGSGAPAAGASSAADLALQPYQGAGVGWVVVQQVGAAPCQTQHPHVGAAAPACLQAIHLHHAPPS